MLMHLEAPSIVVCNLGGEVHKPVLDIRSKETMAVFNDCDYLQLTILENKVIVEGFSDEEDAQNEAKSSNKQYINNIIKITTNKTAKEINKKRIEVTKRYLKQNLNQIVGGEQLSFYEVLNESISYTNYSSQAHSINNAIKSLQLPLTLCSLFSGAGLMDKAFMDDFDIIFALEIDKEACKTYKRNISNHIVNGDIKNYAGKIPHATVLIGGSPCQGFSNSNRQTNYLDNPKNLLVREYIKAVQNSQPYVFVLENVPQIISAGDGKFLKEITEQLKDYEITSNILDATDFGAAQRRKRAVIIGSKIGKINILKPINKYVNTVRNAFKGLNSKVPNQLDYSKPNELTLQRIKSVPEGGNVFNIPEAIRPGGTHSDSYIRLKWDEPSVTIVNPRKAMILHPEEDRILSVRECARLQGLDDDFIFYGSLAAKQQQVCNGVPVPMFKYVSKIVRKAIEKYNINNLNNTITC